MKPTPAFDALDLNSPENEEFGDENVEARHFTKFSAEHSHKNGNLADDKIIKLLNPVRFIGSDGTTKTGEFATAHLTETLLLQFPSFLPHFLKTRDITLTLLFRGACHTAETTTLRNYSLG